MYCTQSTLLLRWSTQRRLLLREVLSKFSSQSSPFACYLIGVSARLLQASEGFTNRWAMVAPAFLTHMCIGSPWAWSVLSGTIKNEMGIVASAAGDW